MKLVGALPQVDCELDLDVAAEARLPDLEQEAEHPHGEREEHLVRVLLPLLGPQGHCGLDIGCVARLYPALDDGLVVLNRQVSPPPSILAP